MPNTFLTYDRQEAGLHSGGKRRMANVNLVAIWDPSIIKFPDAVKKYHYNATQISYFANH